MTLQSDNALGAETPTIPGPFSCNVMLAKRNKGVMASVGFSTCPVVFSLPKGTEIVQHVCMAILEPQSLKYQDSLAVLIFFKSLEEGEMMMADSSEFPPCAGKADLTVVRILRRGIPNLSDNPSRLRARVFQDVGAACGRKEGKLTNSPPPRIPSVPSVSSQDSSSRSSVGTLGSSPPGFSPFPSKQQQQQQQQRQRTCVSPPFRGSLKPKEFFREEQHVRSNSPPLRGSTGFHCRIPTREPVREPQKEQIRDKKHVARRAPPPNQFKCSVFVSHIVAGATWHDLQSAFSTQVAPTLRVYMKPGCSWAHVYFYDLEGVEKAIEAAAAGLIKICGRPARVRRRTRKKKVKRTSPSGSPPRMDHGPRLHGAGLHNLQPIHQSPRPAFSVGQERSSRQERSLGQDRAPPTRFDWERARPEPQLQFPQSQLPYASKDWELKEANSRLRMYSNFLNKREDRFGILTSKKSEPEPQQQQHHSVRGLYSMENLSDDFGGMRWTPSQHGRQHINPVVVRGFHN